MVSGYGALNMFANNPNNPVHLNMNALGVSTIDPRNPFGEDFEGDVNFWNKVSTCFEYEKTKGKNTSWLTIETRLRLERIQSQYEDSNPKKDTLLWLLTSKYKAFETHVTQNNEPELLDAFLKQLSHFVIMLLQEDYLGHKLFQLNEDNPDPDDIVDAEKRTDDDRKYAFMVPLPADITGKIRTSILHIAAENNLCEIANFFLKLYPASICRKDVPATGRKRMAVEYALEYRKDEVCCLLMKAMLNERVRNLFTGDEESPAMYKFSDIIKDPNMKKTVLCVLDSCVNPNFPYHYEDLSKKDERKERGEEAWVNIPGVPLRYNFFFEILDGDENGRPVENKKYFKHQTLSPLQVIANKADNKNLLDPIKHMVVRQLVRRKWDLYGKSLIIRNCVMYIAFLVLMSTALVLGAKSKEPTKYPDTEDKIRAICEIGTLLFTVFYVLMELDQFIKEFNIYITDWYNFFDVLGLMLILILIPCRYSHAVTVTRAISTAAFFVNFIRVFKYFPASKEYGIYAKTFAKIIYTDIRKFFVVFMVVALAFTGSVYVAMCATSSFDDNIKNFWSVLLQELRAISEGKEFADSYSAYHVVLTLFILTNMFTIIVVLVNILIGQLSFRYESAMNDATLQYDIDKARMVTSLERSWFKKWNHRIKHYRRGVFVSDQAMIADLLESWNQLQSTEGEKTEQAIREMVNKRILKRY